VSVASRPSTRASTFPVTKLVFVARGAFPRSTPCVCALRGFLAGRVFPDRTTRRHGLACPPPNRVWWAERVVTRRTSFCAAPTAALAPRPCPHPRLAPHRRQRAVNRRRIPTCTIYGSSSSSSEIAAVFEYSDDPENGLNDISDSGSEKCVLSFLLFCA